MSSEIEKRSHEDLWVLLWSESQNEFHIENIGRCVSRNRRIYLRKSMVDYILLAVYPTASECSGYRRMIEQRRAMYEERGIVPEFGEAIDVE